MRRGDVARWLMAHRPADAREAGWRDGVLALLADVDDPWSRTTFDPGHVTASAFVLSPDGEDLLMIRHKTLGRWLQPGGHLDPGDTDLVAAARREVEEETGVSELDLMPGTPWLLDVDVHDIPDNPDKGEPAHLHHDVRVLFRARSRRLVDTEEVAGCRWVPLDAVEDLETDDSVLRAVGRLRARRDEARDAPRRDSPAAARNVEPIGDVLGTLVSPGATVLELGSGTGQHAAVLAERLEVARWIPTEVDPEGHQSVRARTRGEDRVALPRHVDLSADPWVALEGEQADLVYCANVIHITPIAILHGLMHGAAEHLRGGGHLALYGPFRIGGQLTPDSNRAFDESLRARDPSWGIRDLEGVVAEASRHGLMWQRTVAMPANNKVVVFRRIDDRTGIEDPRAGEVLERWFGPDPEAPDAEVRRAWFMKDPDADRVLAERFGDLVDAALRGELDDWARTPRGRLALVLLLDQFTRQIHRDTPRAFAGDLRAQRLTVAGMSRGDADRLTAWECCFLMMPLMHAEDRAMQVLSVAAFRDLAERDARLEMNLDYAHRHRVIVDRFGRYPHRNAALDRTSTPEEEAFLDEPGSSF